MFRYISRVDVGSISGDMSFETVGAGDENEENKKVLVFVDGVEHRASGRGKLWKKEWASRTRILRREEVICPLLISLATNRTYDGPSPMKGKEIPEEFVEWLRQAGEN